MTRIVHGDVVLWTDSHGRVYCESDGSQVGTITDYDLLAADINAHIASHHD